MLLSILLRVELQLMAVEFGLVEEMLLRMIDSLVGLLLALRLRQQQLLTLLAWHQVCLR